MILAYLLLAAFAYRGLIGSESQAELSRELEEWFFIPTETSPLVVVLLSAWLVYRRREKLGGLSGEPAAWGLALPLLVLAAATLAWSVKTGASHLLAVSLLFGGLGLAGLHFGRQGMRSVAVPALLLGFALPLPAPVLAEVLYRFQLWTAEASGWLLFAFGMPAYVSGDQVLLAEDHFQVIEGCSGLRSVQTLTMVSVLLVDLFGRRSWHAVSLIVLAPFIAFALNGVRVLALILNPRSDVIAIHNLQGVAILLVGLAILYVIDGFLERYENPAGEVETTNSSASQVPRGRHAVALGFLIGVSALSVAIVPWQFEPPSEIRPAEVAVAPGGWRGTRAETDFSFLGTVGYRTLIDRHYESNAGSADLFVMVGDLGDAQASPISPKTVPPGSGWLRESQGVLRRIGTPDGEWLIMRSGARRVLIHHWYEGTDGLLDEFLRGLTGLDSSPWRRADDVLALRLTTEIEGVSLGSLEAARRRLAGFERDLEADLDELRAAAERKQSS